MSDEPEDKLKVVAKLQFTFDPDKKEWRRADRPVIFNFGHGNVRLGCGTPEGTEYEVGKAPFPWTTFRITNEGLPLGEQEKPIRSVSTEADCIIYFENIESLDVVMINFQKLKEMMLREAVS